MKGLNASYSHLSHNELENVLLSSHYFFVCETVRSCLRGNKSSCIIVSIGMMLSLRLIKYQVYIMFVEDMQLPTNQITQFLWRFFYWFS